MLCVMHACLAVLLSWVWLMLPESLTMNKPLCLKMQTLHLNLMTSP